MILTCPECATGYFVDDDKIKPGGRQVRCAACGHRWTAHPEPALELASSEAEGALAKPAAELASDEAAALTAEDLPRAFRDRAEDERRMRQAMVTGVAWGAAAIAVIVILATAVLFRESIVDAWPQTASAYAAIGFPVNPTGLVIEDVRADPSLQEGHATLSISGVIRNISGHAVTAPPLRVSLLNAQGKRVAGQIAALANARIPSGETRHFVTSIIDPPFSAANLQVDFAVGAVVPANPAVAPPGPAPSLALRGPASDSFVSNAIPATPLPVEPALAPANAATAPQ